MIWLIFLLGLLALLAIQPYVREMRRKPMSDAIRTEAPGAFATLSDGVTHYEILGPTRGPFVVCVHGLTTPSPVFHGIAAELGERGFRTLIFDLYGRGYSDRPRVPHTPELFTRQLRELLESLKLNEELTLVGFSMGGSIATAFAAEDDFRLRRLVLIAPTGMTVTMGKMADWVARVPVLGDWVFHMAFPGEQKRAVDSEAALSKDVPEIGAVQLAQFGCRGYVGSVLSSLRHTLSVGMEEAHRRIFQRHLPVMAIWGREDAQVPLRAMAMLTEWNREVRQEVLEDAGHGLPYTHAAQIAGFIEQVVEEERHRAVQVPEAE